MPNLPICWLSASPIAWKLWLVVVQLTTRHVTPPDVFFGGLSYWMALFHQCNRIDVSISPTTGIGVAPIVRIIATYNGCSCNVQQFGCRNLLLLTRPVCCCGVLMHRLKRTEVPDELVAYFVLCDGSGGCWVGVTLREYVVGIHNYMLAMEVW